MTKEETAHLLSASASATEAAAHLVLVPDHNPTDVENLLLAARSTLAFAAECGER